MIPFVFWGHIFGFGLYLFLGVNGLGYGSDSARYFLSFLSLVLALPLPGLALVLIFEKLCHCRTDALTWVAVGVPTSLIAMPFILSFEFTKFHTLFPWLPLYNTLAIFLIFLLTFRQTIPGTWRLQSSHLRNLWRMETWVTLLWFMYILAIVSTYKALPDLDPYYWLTLYREQFTQGVITPLSLHRPLFSALAYIFLETAHVDSYAYFKYLLPFLPMLALPSGLLLASLYRDWRLKLIVLGLPLASASFILYSKASIPQAVFNLILIMAAYFLAYGAETGKRIFYYGVGVLFLSGYFFYEFSGVLFCIWLIVTIAYEHRHIWDVFRANPTISILVLALVFSYLSFFFELIRFFTSWTLRVVILVLQASPNFLFPASFTNVDGQVVGWGDGVGVIKYYAYYLGPASGMALGLLLWRAASLVWSRFRGFRSVSTLFRISEEKMLLLVLATLFLCLGEVMPRFFGIAFLPERALGFATPFLLVVALLFLSKLGERRQWLLWLVILGLALNAAGAWYVNSLKRHLITQEQIISAEWIKGVLPANRLFFTYGNTNLLRIHGMSPTFKISRPDFYSDISVFDEAYAHFKGQNIDPNRIHRQSMKEVEQLFSELKRFESKPDAETTVRLLEQYIERLTTFEKRLASRLADTAGDPSTEPTLYIYYAKPHPDHPYLDRPYFPKSELLVNQLVFDRYRDRFERVYTLPQDMVVIWRVKQ